MNSVCFGYVRRLGAEDRWLIVGPSQYSNPPARSTPSSKSSPWGPIVVDSPPLPILTVSDSLYARPKSTSACADLTSSISVIINRDNSDGIDHTGDVSLVRSPGLSLISRAPNRHDQEALARPRSSRYRAPQPHRHKQLVAARPSTNSSPSLTLRRRLGPRDARHASRLCSLPVKGAKMRRVDFLGVPFNELPAALLYFTGNQVSSRSPRLSSTMEN